MKVKGIYAFFLLSCGADYSVEGLGDGFNRYVFTLHNDLHRCARARVLVDTSLYTFLIHLSH